jgi:predicted protein tyrosine phosphatase
MNGLTRFKFEVTDRESVQEGLRMRSAYALISIRDPDRPKVKVPKSTLLKAILSLVFHDAEPTAGFRLPDNVRLMTVEDAKAIWSFVRGLPPDVSTIVVHCEQGMSRSPAVAVGLCQGLGIDATELLAEFMPNAYVMKLVKEAAEVTL